MKPVDPNEAFRIRHNPDKAPRKIKNSMAPYELLTAEQTARVLGLTRQRVVQIERGALAKIRRALQQQYDEL
jgi:DNA-directed RNA polymerase sigma subunit (sigma70/sigma32)